MTDIKQYIIKSLVDAGIEKNEAALEAYILIEHVCGYSKKDILLNANIEITRDQKNELQNLLRQRIENNKPVQHLVNKAPFMGLNFYVDENVLIPRPETELLVRHVIDLCNDNAASILDIGTGSGCIAILLCKNFSYLRNITVTDISLNALGVAKRNAKALGVSDQIEFVQSDLFENVEGTFDVIVSNPPYIPQMQKDDLQNEVLMHEPHQALFAQDEKGIYFYEQIIKQAKEYLNKGGLIAFELGIGQAELVQEVFAQEGYKDIVIIKDFAGIKRVISAKN